MKPFISYPKVIPVLLAWLTCIIVIYGSYDHYTLFNYFANRVLIGIASIITLIVFFRDNSQYKREQDLKAFTATIIAGVCVGVLLLTVWLLKQRDNTPTVLYAREPHKLSFVSIDLRKNKTFKITSSALFETKYIRGPYELKDSLLILDRATSGEILDENRFIIRTVSFNDSIEKAERRGIWGILTRDNLPDTSARVYLIPINANGTVIKNARHFQVGWKPPGD